MWQTRKYKVYYFPDIMNSEILEPKEGRNVAREVDIGSVNV